MSSLLVLVPYLCICLVAYGDCLSTNGEQRLSDLEERFAILASHVEQLERREQQSQAEIQSLKTELRAQKHRTDELEKLVMRQSLVIQGDDGENIKDQDAGIVSTKRADKGKIVNKRGGIDGHRNKRLENEQTVAFYATLYKHVLHAGAHQNVVFDHVFTNVGKAYSDSLGAFTAPVPGLYVFSVCLTAYGSETEHYALSKNNQIVSYMYARADHSPYMTTGQTAILQLAQGDNIEIQTLDADGSLHGSHYSAFAGFLLQQDFGTATVVG